MIIFYENGRLGNQIIQYLGVKTIDIKYKKLYLIGFDDIFSLYSNINARKVSINSFFIKKLIKIIIKISPNFLINKITESADGIINFNKDNALLNNIDNCYFANVVNLINNPILSELVFNENKYSEAKFIFSSSSSTINSCVVHFRRNDYLSWPNAEHPAVLSASWYIYAMNKMRKNGVQNFIFIGDDYFYMEDVANLISSQFDIKVIKSNDKYVDFILMTFFNHAIISASTFALTASSYIKNRNNKSIIYAPRNWIFHREKYPKNYANCISFVDFI